MLLEFWTGKRLTGIRNVGNIPRLCKDVQYGAMGHSVAIADREICEALRLYEANRYACTDTACLIAIAQIFKL